MATQLENPLLAELDRQTADLVRSAEAVQTSSVYLTELRLAKLGSMLDYARQDTPDAAPSGERILELQDRLVSVELELSRFRRKAAAAAATGAAVSSAVSVHTAASSESLLTNRELLDELNSLPSESAAAGLRQRGGGRQRGDGPGGVIDSTTKLEMNTDVQGDMSEEILEMVRTIKQNALLFSQKLEADNSVVDSATNAISNAASKMDSVGSRLSKYRSSTALGWWFYVKASIFLVVALVGGLLLIQLFPKL